jgi:hypothetical protein
MQLLIMHTVDKPSLNKPTNNNEEFPFLRSLSTQSFRARNGHVSLWQLTLLAALDDSPVVKSTWKT